MVVRKEKRRTSSLADEWEGLGFGKGGEEKGAQGDEHGVGGDAIATRSSYGGGGGRGRRMEDVFVNGLRQHVAPGAAGPCKDSGNTQVFLHHIILDFRTAQ